MDKSQQSSARVAKIQMKKNQLQKVTEEIRTLDTQAKKKNLELLKQKESHTANRLSKSRIIMHNNATSNDKVLRPCDRGNDIRTYSKMDLDVWQYPQVRDWWVWFMNYWSSMCCTEIISNLITKYHRFNEFGQPVPPVHESPAETGYMIGK